MARKKGATKSAAAKAENAEPAAENSEAKTDGEASPTANGDSVSHLDICPASVWTFAWWAFGHLPGGRSEICPAGVRPYARQALGHLPQAGAQTFSSYRCYDDRFGFLLLAWKSPSSCCYGSYRCHSYGTLTFESPCSPPSRPGSIPCSPTPKTNRLRPNFRFGALKIRESEKLTYSEETFGIEFSKNDFQMAVNSLGFRAQLLRRVCARPISASLSNKSIWRGRGTTEDDEPDAFRPAGGSARTNPWDANCRRRRFWAVRNRPTSSWTGIRGRRTGFWRPDGPERRGAAPTKPAPPGRTPWSRAWLRLASSRSCGTWNKIWANEEHA
ncbi:unnamed protein product [Nesidiocoris tenuis]|uniref:Uncharacterized protein n=1 Tax=Nesidiocoris tenuis TaxID=355587 RepID=A0A6H5HM42_9HEMI|nr:unnamed protein product [Nesidiocoris tenuis]